MKNLSKAILAAVLLLMAVFIFSGCSKTITEADVSYAGEMLENVLAGIKEKNYDKFSKDFSDTVKNVLTKDKFDSLITLLDTKIGEYKEKTYAGASETKSNNMNLTVVIYKAKYTKETEDVVITLTFSDNNGVKKIEGFNLNSPNLRK